MANDQNYICSVCGQSTARNLLTVKKTTFVEMGMGGRHVRSRVRAWLCPTCLVKDDEYTLPAHKGPEPGGVATVAQLPPGFFEESIDA